MMSRVSKRFVRLEFVDATGIAIEVPTTAHIHFQVAKVDKRQPDTADITVYNLGPDSRAMVGSEAMTVNLYAGTVDPPPLLFRGEITDVPIYRSDDFVDWIVQVLAEDTKSKMQTDIVARSYASGTPLRQVFQDIAAAGGLAADASRVSGRLTYPLPLLGSPAQLLAEASGLHGYRYQVINAMVVLAPEDEPIDMVSVPTINGRTGMIGVPVSRIERKQVKVFTETLLDATIRPGALCSIETGAATGGRRAPISPKATYWIEEANYICDESRFRVEISGRPYAS